MKVKRSAGAKVGLIVGLVLCAGLTWCGIDFWREAKRAEAEFEAVRLSEPARLAVDLAKPGVYEAPLVQTCSHSRAQGVFVEADPPFGSEAEIREALDGLSFDLRIRDAAGRDVIHHAGAHAPQPYVDWVTGQRAWSLTFFYPFDVGEYRLVFKVLEPAPGMAGRPHALVVKYMLCGCGALVWLLGPDFAAGCFVLTAIIGIVTIALWWRAGRRARARLAAEAGSAA